MGECDRCKAERWTRIWADGNGRRWYLCDACYVAMRFAEPAKPRPNPGDMSQPRVQLAATA